MMRKSEHMVEEEEKKENPMLRSIPHHNQF